MKTRILCILLTGALLLSLAGCAFVPQGSTGTQNTQDQRVDLMKTVKTVKKEAEPITPEATAAASDFALRLFRAANDPDRNTLISPLSVLCALAMAANGAEDATLFQMESTLGMRRDLYNDFFSSYLSALRSDSSNALKLANSIWFTDRNGFEPKEVFLAVNAACYGADAYLAPFDDSTAREINGWVNEKTDGMIPSILDQIPDDAVMYLVNALAFDAKWSHPYAEYEVSLGEFNAADSTKQAVEFMHSEEGTYLSDDNTTGFIKYYLSRDYAFVALLPDEGISVEEYLDSLDGEKLQNLLTNRSQETVVAVMPKFETQTSLELSEVLKTMGMELPFDSENADFSSMGTSQAGNLSISHILHKTFISVAEDGTRAGAATAMEAVPACEPEEEPKRVRLDRPFVYMLIDCETNLPFFIGTMMKPGA
ncbi:MAG: serpin family protein [Oscillospiraceae bacterium]|nr:serpin family protein [Oscillospiraceae bacterium]